MSANNPITVSMSGFDSEDFQQFLQNPNRPTASHVLIIFRATNGGPEGRGIVLGDESDKKCLMKTKEDLASWMGVICGQLPALTHLTLRFVPGGRSGDCPFSLDSFPVGGLGAIFQHCKTTLKSFRISNNNHAFVNLGGSQEDYQFAWHYLSCMQRLERFCVRRCSVRRILQYGEQNKRLQDVPLFIALQAVPTLRDMSLHDTMQTDTAFQCLQMLEQNRTLESLSLGLHYGRYFDSHAHIPLEDFEGVLGNLWALKKLDLAVLSSAEVHHVVSSVLRGLQRNQSLVKLKIRMAQRDSAGRHVLPSDATLDGIKKEYEGHLKQALRTNQTLSQVHIKAFAGTIRDMEARGERDLPLDDPPKFWLKMNGIGRKALLEDLQHKRWISNLVDQKEDHQVSFYLLSTNLSVYLPFLIQASKGQVDPSVPVTPEKKSRSIMPKLCSSGASEPQGSSLDLLEDSE